MGKFTLLTTLTLQAAGFDKGIDKAKKGAKALSDGVQTAGSTISKALSPLGDQIGSIGGEFTSIATGGISAFKKMIPAITSVRTAIISTGIGALIIAITTAITGLISWMKRTDEGADAMRNAFNIVKAVINTTLEKLGYLGSAIVKLFKGDFKGAAEDAKTAMTGWGDAIRDNVDAANKLNEAQDKLEAFEVDYQLKREKIVARIAEMEFKIKDDAYRQTLSVQEKVDLLNKYKSAQEALYALDKQKFNLEISAAQEAYNIGAKNEDTLKELNDKRAEGLRLDAQHNDELRASLRLTQEITKEIEAEQNTIRELPIDISSVNNAFGSIVTTIKSQIPEMQNALAVIKPAEILSADKLAPFIDSLSYLKLKFKETMDEMQKDSLTTGQVLFNAFNTSIKSMSDSLIQGADNFKEYGKSIKSIVKQVIGAFIAEGVAALVKNALESAATTPFGFLMAAPLAALAGGVAKTAFNSLLPKFHTGGIVGGVSDVTAVLKPREMVLTTAQQGNLYNMINKGGSMSGEVVFTIDGTQLIGVLNNYQRRVNSYR